ncbi:unnamed protein product [Ilex paraguariensis]|uniref:Uncharacterized protein n=1 Tax=Ilex paraguariensis TaxID=185542 RepID=A0ABC8SWN2_9AQUA
MVRTPFFDKNGLKRGLWSEEEDNKLRAYIERYGHWNWRQLPKYAGLSRCGKSCRLRWKNYLRTDVKLRNYSKEEEDTIMKLQDKLGNKWSAIAAHLPGRTDNDIKNYWHTHIKKLGKPNSTSEVLAQSNVPFQPESKQKEKFHETSQNEGNKERESEPEYVVFDTASDQALESTPTSPKASSSDQSSSSSITSTFKSTNWVAEDSIVITSHDSFYDTAESFWSVPFVTDTFYDQNYYTSPSTHEGFLPPYMWFYY